MLVCVTVDAALFSVLVVKAQEPLLCGVQRSIEGNIDREFRQKNKSR